MGVQHLSPRWEPGRGPVTDEGDTLFVLNPTGEAGVLAEGGRLADEYSGYFAPGTGRAPLVPGPFGRLGVGQGTGDGRPALVYPLDGLLSMDELTLTLWVRVLRAGVGPATLVEAARVLTVEFDDSAVGADSGGSVRVALPLFEAEVTVAAGPEQLPVGRWAPIIVTWDGATLTASVGAQECADGAEKGRATAEADENVARESTPVASWADGGLLILPGAAVGAPGLEVAELVIQRYCRQPGENRVFHGPTVTVDVGSPTGQTWSPHLGGALALYTGMRVWRDGVGPDVGVAVRDQQFAACAAAGIPLVRVGGVVSAVQVRDDGTYDFAWLDDKVAEWRRRDVALHLTLDYNHPRTGAVTGDWGSLATPPDDAEVYAELCSRAVAHLRGTNRVVSVALWNEPDIGDYWVGGMDAFFALWEVVQRRFMVDHPDLLLGTGDFAHATTTVQHLRFIAAQGLPVSAAYFHNYHQDVGQLAGLIASVRAAATAAGFAELPIRITEWGMDILRQQELYVSSTSVNRAWPNRFRGAAAGALCLAFLATAADADPFVDMATFSSIGSVELEFLNDAGLFIADEAMLSSDDPPRPFPSFNAMALLWKLTGTRVSAASNWPSVRAVATSDGDTTTLVFGAYRPWRGNTDTLDVALDWSGLPERFRWKQWTVDEPHGADGRLVLTGEGDETDLPHGVRIGALSVACIQITYATDA